jgi:hypothetical protein
VVALPVNSYASRVDDWLTCADSINIGEVLNHFEETEEIAILKMRLETHFGFYAFLSLRPGHS